MKPKSIMLGAVILLVFGVSQAQADMAQIKAYKEAFPDAKLKCINCHTSDQPKKEQGKHDSNAYGLKVKEVNPKPTAETYKTVGKIEDFKPQGKK